MTGSYCGQSDFKVAIYACSLILDLFKHNHSNNRPQTLDISITPKYFHVLYSMNVTVCKWFVSFDKVKVTLNDCEKTESYKCRNNMKRNQVITSYVSDMRLHVVFVPMYKICTFTAKHSVSFSVQNYIYFVNKT